MSLQDLRTLREHAVYLATQLENERNASRAKTEFLKRLVSAEDLGHAVRPEVRNLAYQLLINESLKCNNSYSVHHPHPAG
jgi:hypothetical protein